MMSNQKTIYELFGYSTKEDLYAAITENSPTVKELITRFEFEKASIINQNKPIGDPETLIDYFSGMQPPTINESKIIYVNSQNKPVLLDTINIHENDLKPSIRNGLNAGAKRAFVLIHPSTHPKRLDRFTEFMKAFHLPLLDILVEEKNLNFYSIPNDKHFSGKRKERDLFSEIPEGVEIQNNDYLRDSSYSEFARYYALTEIKKTNVMNGFDEIKNLLKIGYQNSDREIFGLGSITETGQVSDIKELHVGGIDASIVDLTLLGKELLVNEPQAIFVYHNHPGGSLKPSEADEKVTENIALLCDELNIKFLDHFISTKEKTVSLREVPTLKTHFTELPKPSQLAAMKAKEPTSEKAVGDKPLEQGKDR